MADITGVEFETEMREGVPHFKPGQSRAVRDAEEPDVALLLSTNQFGHCVALACWRERGTDYCAGQWFVDADASFTMFASGMTGPLKIPPCFELSEEAIRELDKAEVVPGEER